MRRSSGETPERHRLTVRIFCVTAEVPFPPNHGANVDIWHRYLLLRDSGCSIMLFTWSSDAFSQSQVQRLSEVFSSIEVVSIKKGVRDIILRLRHLPRHSHFVGRRMLSREKIDALSKQVESFQADVVVAEEVYGAPVARAVAERLKLPFFYRSHNVEFKYMRGQAQATHNWLKKASLYAGSLNLRRDEMAAQQAARAIFDISDDDAAYWRSRGVKNNLWLPSLFSRKPTCPLDWRKRPYDLVYLGNLYTPNNIFGLAWFFEKVLPFILVQCPGLTVCVAGSSPSKALYKLLQGVSCAELVPNPDDASTIWNNGRVLFNPVRSGSGANVKSSEMLFCDAHLVSTSVGVRGLPLWIRSEFSITDDALQFATAVVDGLKGEGFYLSQRRVAARDFLSEGSISMMLDVIRKSIGDAP